MTQVLGRDRSTDGSRASQQDVPAPVNPPTPAQTRIAVIAGQNVLQFNAGTPDTPVWENVLSGDIP